MKDETKFKEFLTALCEIHDKNMSQLLTRLYWETLSPFDDEACESAFKELIFTAKFFPKPAEFMELLRGKKQDIAAIAWVEVVKTLKHTGTYESVQFADPVIHSVIDAMGGWIKLGEMVEDEEKWRAKEFERLYSIMDHRGNHPQYLIGICERDNGANGFEHERKPVLIGSPGKPAPLRLVGRT